jgi:P4 family phage/plasmid primase-like protien
METQGFKFANTKDIDFFVYSTVTDKANFFAKCIEDDIKIIGKQEDCYFYDQTKKLWVMKNKGVYKTFVYEWFNVTTKHIKHMYSTEQNNQNVNVNVDPAELLNENNEIDEKKVKEINDKQKQLKEAMKAMEKDIDKRNKLLAYYDTDAFIESIIKRAMGKLADDAFVKLLDNDPHFFPINNGKKINLKTLEITSRTSADYFTFESPVAYVKSRKHAEKFFTQLFPDKLEREYFRKVSGYFLSGDVSGRCFFAFYGDGMNGKSTFGNLLQEIMMPFYHQCDKSIFIKSNNVGGATPQKAALLSKRAAIYAEGETADEMDLNFSSIKEISGDDPINARQIYKDPIVFKAQCILVMMTNFVLPLTAEKAVKDRLRYVFFDQVFTKSKENSDFIDSLKTKYLSEIFSWIVDGTKEYYTDLKIEMPESFTKRTNDLLSQEDSIESFMSNKITLTGNNKDYMRKGQLFDEYRQYCNDNSQRCQPRSTLFNRLSHAKWQVNKKDGYDVYRGFIINDKTDEEVSDLDNIASDTDNDAYIKKLQKQIKKLEKLIDAPASPDECQFKKTKVHKKPKKKYVKVLKSKVETIKDEEEKDDSDSDSDNDNDGDDDLILSLF